MRLELFLQILVSPGIHVHGFCMTNCQKTWEEKDGKFDDLCYIFPIAVRYCEAIRCGGKWLHTPHGFEREETKREQSHQGEREKTEWENLEYRAWGWQATSATQYIHPALVLLERLESFN